MNRRFFLWLLAPALLLAQPETKPLTILHFNDLHAQLEPNADGAGGIAALASVIRREKANCQACLVLGAGDFVQGSPVSTIFRGLPIIELANLLGLDAATLGNHEYDYGWQKVDEFRGTARFPFLVSNITDADGRPAAQPYRIFHAGGLRVAVIGAMTMDLRNLQIPAQLGAWRTTPVVETVRGLLREVREKSDFLILLAHLTPAEEDQVLRDLPEVPLTIGGHAHFTATKTYDGRMVVRVKASGQELGRLDLRVAPSANRIVSSVWNPLVVNRVTAKPAPDVQAAVVKWEEKVTALMDVAIADSRRVWAGPDLKALIERALVEETGADFAFCNRGGIRGQLPQGPVLVRHIWNAFPFDNRVVKGKFLGAQLPPMVTGGRTVDPARTYTLVTSDYVAANQPTQLNTSGLEFPETGPLQRDLLVEWVKKRKVLE